MNSPRHRKRVRVELLGGLGNQLFQAAAGYTLAKRLGATLEFDVSRFRGGARSFALSGLAHGGLLVPPSGFVAKSLSRVARGILPASQRRPPGWWGNVFREASYAYDERFESLIGNVCLVGYFQSYRYTLPFLPELREAFDLKAIASERALSWSDRLLGNSLSVHVRRGDFGSNSTFNNVHGMLPTSYYKRSLDLMIRSRSPDKIFIFSDDVEAARKIVPTEFDVDFIQGLSAVDDLFLMSRARHHIIANSTFSWWGAWLQPQPDALTIAPRAWLSAGNLKKNYIGDLYPDGWILI
jgi:hypothetical protein